MSHSLFRLTESICNTPHLMSESALANILNYLDNRNFGIVPAPVEQKQKKQPIVLQGIGEILIDGSLSYKKRASMCGEAAVSYESILEDAQMLIDSGITTLVTTHSSGGGEAAHCFDTAEQLRAMCDEAGVTWVSYTDTISASASYLLSSTADIVIAHPEASVGSIGCVLALVDKSKAYEQAGLKPIYITSTEGKVPFNLDGSFSESFLKEVKDSVTTLGQKFAEHVSQCTGLSVDSILATDAKMFPAEKALSMGLINGIMTHKEFAAFLQNMDK